MNLKQIGGELKQPAWENVELDSKKKKKYKQTQKKKKFKQTQKKRSKAKTRTHSLMYACVGKFTGSHPILMALVG